MSKKKKPAGQERAPKIDPILIDDTSKLSKLQQDLRRRAAAGDWHARVILAETYHDYHSLLGISLVLTCVAAYLVRGFSVVPQLPGQKSPCIKWKPFQKRQPTVAEALDWWTYKWPEAGVAIILGYVSHLFAIDVDGEEAHDVLSAHLSCIPLTPRVRSGSQKKHRYHLFFRHPGLRTKAKATPWHPNLEFRGHGGIVVGPPSIHPSGRRYKFAPGLSFADIRLADVPAEVLSALQKLAPKKSAIVRPDTKVVSVADIRGISRATREFLTGEFAAGPDWNSRLFRASCDMAGVGFKIEDAEPQLLKGAQPWNDDELAAARVTIASAFAEDRQSARKYARNQHANTVSLRIQLPAKEDRSNG